MSRQIINDYIRTRLYEEDKEPEPKSEVWEPPEDDYGSFDSLLRRMDLNNPKYDWRKTTTKGRFSNKNLGLFLFDIL